MPAASPPSPALPQILNSAYDSDGISGLSNEDVTLSDTTAVSVLNTLDDHTAGTIDAGTVTTLTGAAADLNTAYTANDNGSISGLSNEDVTLSDTTLDVATLNTLDGNTSGTIDASSINTLTGAAADLNSPTTQAASQTLMTRTSPSPTPLSTLPSLNTLDGNTSGTIDASSINTLTGAADDLINAFASNGITGLGDEAVNVSSGTATTDQANTLADATSAVVTATLSDGDLETLADLNETGNAYTITITDTSADAAALNTLDGKTTAAINAANINTLTGAAADLNTAYDSDGITGLDDEDITLSDTSLAVSILNTLDGNTSGTIDASSINTLTSEDYDSLNDAYTAADSGAISGLGNEEITVDNKLRASEANTLNSNTSGVITATITDSDGTGNLDVSNALTLEGTGNAYSILIKNKTVSASNLLTIDGITTVTVKAKNISTLSGSYADLISAYAAESAGTISGLGGNCNFDVSESITVAEANDLALIITHNSKSLTATISDGDMATLAGISESGHNLSITITDTSVDAAALNTLDGKTTVAINAANINTLTGATADLNTAYDSDGITGLDDEDITLTDTTLAVSILNTLDGNTSGTIDASSINTLTGAAEDLNTAYASNGITGLDDEDVTLTDTTLDAAVLNTLDGNTAGTIDASSINTLTGAADDLINAFASNGITGLGDEAVNVSSGTATTDQANTLADATSAVVTATLSDGDLETLADLNETGNAYTITITDTSVDAAALNTLDGKTTVAINAANITTLTGAAVDLNTAYDSDGITGLDDEDITLSDTSLAVSILNTLDGNTSGTIDASSINTLTGAAADLNTAYASGGITGLDDEDITLTDTTLAVSILNTLDGNTSGTIDASSINTLTGAADDLNTAYDRNDGITGLDDEDVTL